MTERRPCVTRDRRPRGMSRRRGGWVTAALALTALVLVGFLCGALAGFLWEEPGLVIAYLSGETEEVEWAEPGPVAAAPPSEAVPKLPMGPTPTTPAAEPEPERVAKVAPPPAPKPVAKPAPKPVPAPAPVAPVAPKPEPKPVAAAPPGRYAVQVGAFGESDAAESLAARLRDRGYTSYVRASTDGDSRWRVRVGPVTERSTAEALASKLEKTEKLPTWVLDEGEG